MAANGSMSVTSPVTSSIEKPAGAFIQALTAMMQNVPNAPEIMIGISVFTWTRGGRRSHP